MNSSLPSNPPAPAPTDAAPLPTWAWLLAGTGAVFGGWWSWSATYTDHPQGLIGALIPPTFVMLTILSGWLVDRTRTRLFTALRWQFVVWGGLAFSVGQVAATSWERTGSIAAVVMMCVGVLPMLPAVCLVSHTLSHLKRST